MTKISLTDHRHLAALAVAKGSDMDVARLLDGDEPVIDAADVTRRLRDIERALEERRTAKSPAEGAVRQTMLDQADPEHDYDLLHDAAAAPAAMPETVADDGDTQDAFAEAKPFTWDGLLLAGHEDADCVRLHVTGQAVTLSVGALVRKEWERRAGRPIEQAILYVEDADWKVGILRPDDDGLAAKIYPPAVGGTPYGTLRVAGIPLAGCRRRRLMEAWWRSDTGSAVILVPHSFRDDGLMLSLDAALAGMEAAVIGRKLRKAFGQVARLVGKTLACGVVAAGAVGGIGAAVLALTG